jgi:hypothetical protein
MSETVADTGGDRALVRARMVILFVAYTIVAVAAGSIFDRWQVALVVAPVLPTAAALLVVGRRFAVRVASAAVAIGGTVVVAVLSSGAGDARAGDVVDAFSSGLQRLLSTEWPSPQRPDLIGAVAAVLATATAVSHELAWHRRFHLLPLLPVLLCYLGVVGLSAPLGPDWTSLALFAVLATLFAMVRNDGTLHDRLVLLRGERRTLPLLAVAVAVVALISVPLSLTARADPRRNEPATQIAPLLDPVHAALALRAIDPPIELHAVTTEGVDTLPSRWRTAALAAYDGARWSPTLTLRPIGTTLGAAEGPTVRAQVRFLDERVSLVPLPGDPVSVDADVETDADRTVVRLANPVDPDDEIALVANRPPTRGDAVAQGVAVRVVDETGSPLKDLAAGLAGDGSPVDQLNQLETTMRDDFVLDSEVQGGGLQVPLIERFLRDTRRGTAEQFTTAFVLLAQSLGIEARVATGFVVADPDLVARTGSGGLTLTSSDAAIWPEVQLTGGQWLAFDPVPAEEASESAPPPPKPQVQTPAAPQPPIAPPPEPNETNRPPEVLDDAGSADPLSTAIVWAIRSTVAAVVMLLPFVLAAVAVAVVKRRRRRRRLQAARPTDRVRGAWASATDVLVDAGLQIEASSTDGEIAGHGAPLVADARRDLHRLATLASAATYGRPSHPELLAEDATRCLEAVEASMAAERSRWQRVRWRLSLRSLRPATRSPVTI